MFMQRYSKKLFIPKEYSTDVSNLELIANIVDKTEDLKECIYYLAVNILNLKLHDVLHLTIYKTM